MDILGKLVLGRKGSEVITHPSALSERVQPEFISDLSGVHGILYENTLASAGSTDQEICSSRHSFHVITNTQKPEVLEGLPYRKILLVRKYQEQRIPQLILVQHALQLLAGFNDTIAIVAIDDEDDALGILKVMPP